MSTFIFWRISTDCRSFSRFSACVRDICLWISSVLLPELSSAFSRFAISSFFSAIMRFCSSIAIADLTELSPMERLCSSRAFMLSLTASRSFSRAVFFIFMSDIFDERESRRLFSSSIILLSSPDFSSAADISWQSLASSAPAFSAAALISLRRFSKRAMVSSAFFLPFTLCSATCSIRLSSDSKRILS